MTEQEKHDDSPQLTPLDPAYHGLPESWKDDPFTYVLESFIRMSVAGFGGALIGIVMARKGNPTAKSVIQRGKPYRDTNLPASWAVACITFSGAIETVKLSQPTSRLFTGVNQYLGTMVDMSIGGALAGALFRGAQIRSASSKAPIIAPRIMAGLGPGLLLGILAGVLQSGGNYATDEIQKIEDEKKRLRKEAMRNQIKEAKRIEREELEAEIAALDAKELQEAQQKEKEQEDRIIAATKHKSWWKLW